MPASVGSVSPANGAFGVQAELPITVLIDRTDSTNYEKIETSEADFQAGTLVDVVAKASGALELLNAITEDFEGQTIGQTPTGWSVISGTWTTESIDSQKALRRAAPGSSAINDITWTDAGTITDIDLYLDFNAASTADPTIILRSGSGSPTPDCYLVNMDYPNQKVLLQKFVSGSPTTLAQPAKTLSTGTWYRARIQLAGTTIRVKVWARSGSEPGSWDIDTTDSTYSSGGFRLRVYLNANVWWDNFVRMGGSSYVPSGNRVSPTYSLTSVGKAGQAIAEWDVTLPTGTSLTIESRINGGSWETLTNGGAIPGIADGDDLTGDTIELRETLSTTDDSETPSLTEVRLIFRAQDASLVEIVVNGVSNTLANGGLAYYGTVNVSGGALVDDHQHVYYETRRRYFTVPGTLTVTVDYNSSTISTTAFTTDPAEQWASYGPGFWTAWTTSPAWLSGAGNGWLAVVDRALSLTGADGYFKVLAAAGGMADGYYLVGHMVRWIGPESAALGSPARDVGPGSASLQGWQRGIGPESATLQGWIRPIGQETATLGIVFRDVSPGAAALGIPTRGIAPGSATLYGVARETSLELDVISDDTQDILDYLGITVS